MKYLKPFGTQSFVLGIGLAALTYLIGPSVKRGARSVAVKGMQGALMAGEAASNAVDTGKEKASSLFQNLMNRGHNHEAEIIERKQLFNNMMNEMKEERRQNRELMQSMLETMQSMQKEISSIKKTTPKDSSTK